MTWTTQGFFLKPSYLKGRPSVLHGVLGKQFSLVTDFSPHLSLSEPVHQDSGGASEVVVVEFSAFDLDLASVEGRHEHGDCIVDGSVNQTATHVWTHPRKEKPRRR